MISTDFTVVVLAGEREPGADPLAKAAGAISKVLVPIAGVAVIDRTVTAIEATPGLRHRLLAGPRAQCWRSMRFSMSALRAVRGYGWKPPHHRRRRWPRR
ncbi:MAG: hypothetical protein HC809_12930 [Gammaproteobacteria bacterium]|nr:hypothetical protein [Gammaproteobacteria bacterium]